MKRSVNSSRAIFLLVLMLSLVACENVLDELPENKAFAETTDYTISENTILPLIGVYDQFYAKGWPNNPLMAVRGDDVNAGGLGDQQDFAETDEFHYNKDYWMYNAVMTDEMRVLFHAHSAMEQIALYKEASGNPDADQYIAEAKVIRAWVLFWISRTWGSFFIPGSSDPSELLVAEVHTKDEIMQHLVDQMDEAIPELPNMHPNKRTDIPGGVTRYTAQAIKALALLELEDYQGVADATGAIISSGLFSLEPDFYELFKLKGKLNDENLLELQYSDFGQGEGDQESYLYAFYGPQSWIPKIEGIGTGWGFWEPSLTWIKFMLDRGETIRLETSVCFTNRGITEIQKDPDYASLPAWISNTTPSGDIFNDYPRALFASGKHYLPSDQMTPGRTGYGNNKNYVCIRYAEILLIYAEALTQGASGSVMTATEAVNLVRARVSMPALSSVTNDDVMDEKFAELAMEWGDRYYDMVRLGKYDVLSYEGRTFTEDLIYLPYPQAQVDLMGQLANAPASK
jgi:hypothetical protein